LFRRGFTNGAFDRRTVEAGGRQEDLFQRVDILARGVHGDGTHDRDL